MNKADVSLPCSRHQAEEALAFSRHRIADLPVTLRQEAPESHAEDARADGEGSRSTGTERGEGEAAHRRVVRTHSAPLCCSSLTNLNPQRCDHASRTADLRHLADACTWFAQLQHLWLVERALRRRWRRRLRIWRRLLVGSLRWCKLPEPRPMVQLAGPPAAGRPRRRGWIPLGALDVQGCGTGHTCRRVRPSDDFGVRVRRHGQRCAIHCVQAADQIQPDRAGIFLVLYSSECSRARLLSRCPRTPCR